MTHDILPRQPCEAIRRIMKEYQDHVILRGELIFRTHGSMLPLICRQDSNLYVFKLFLPTCIRCLLLTLLWRPASAGRRSLSGGVCLTGVTPTNATLTVKPVRAETRLFDPFRHYMFTCV